MPRKRNIYFAIAFLVAQLVSLTQGVFVGREVYADEPHDEIVTIDKVLCAGEELEKKFDENAGVNYYDIPKTNSSVTINLFMDNLHSDTVYMISGSSTEFTSDDNGKISTVTLSPSSVNSQYDTYLSENGIVSYSYPSLQIKHQQESGYSTEYLFSIDSLYFKSSTIGTDSISLISISQNGTELEEYLNGFKTSDYVSPISVTYEIKDLPLETSFFAHAHLYGGIGSGSYSSMYADNDTQTFTEELRLGLGNEIQDLSISYDYGYHPDYHSEYFNVPIVIDNPEYIPFGDLYIDSVNYDDNSIEPVCSEQECVFELNDVYNYSIGIHTDQAIENAEYTVTYDGRYLSSGDVTYSGLELKGGVTLYSTGFYKSSQYGSSYSGISFYQLDSQQQFYYINELGTRFRARLSFSIDPTVARIDSVDLTYSNTPDKVVRDYGFVDLRYHNSENPLAINVKGENFIEDQKYAIGVMAYKTHGNGSGEMIYDEDFEVSGASMNEGSLIRLDGLVLELGDEILPKDGIQAYKFVVSYEGQTYCFSVNYGFDGANRGIIVASDTEDSNEILLLSTSGVSVDGASYRTQYNDFILHYSVPNLPSDYVFGYEVYQYDDTTHYMDIFREGSPIHEGTLTGEQIQNGELSFEAGVGYRYGIIIKYDGHIINWNIYSFALSSNSTMISSVIAYSDGTVLPISYYQAEVYDVPMGESISFALHGFGFDEGLVYSVVPVIGWMGFSYGQGGGMIEPREDFKMNFTGKELNDGTAIITIPFCEEFGAQANIENWSLSSYGYRTAGFIINDDEPSLYMGMSGVTFAYSNRKFTTELLGEDNIIDGETSIYVSVDDYKHFDSESNGIAGLIGDIEYDSDMLELVSIEGQNGFEVETGEHYVLHDTTGLGVVAGTKIMKLNFRNIGLARGEETTIAFKNITGSDGFNDISSEEATKTISIYNPTPVIEEMPFIVSENILSKVSTGTTVASFQGQVTLGGFASLKFVTAEGQEMSATDKIGTGVKVQLLNYYSEVANEYTVKIKGDINGDGEITITDLVKAKRHLAASSGATLAGIYAAASDITGSGTIGITDIVKICRHIAQVEAIEQ